MTRHKSQSYKQPIRIECRTNAQDDYEDITETWSPIHNTPFIGANFRSIGDRERSVAQQQGDYYDAEFRIRYYPGIRTEYRVVLMNNTHTSCPRTFNIVSAHDVDEEHFEILIRCVEKN